MHQMDSACSEHVCSSISPVALIRKIVLCNGLDKDERTHDAKIKKMKHCYVLANE